MATTRLALIKRSLHWSPTESAGLQRGAAAAAPAARTATKVTRASESCTSSYPGAHWAAAAAAITSTWSASAPPDLCGEQCAEVARRQAGASFASSSLVRAMQSTSSVAWTRNLRPHYSRRPGGPVPIPWGRSRNSTIGLGALLQTASRAGASANVPQPPPGGSGGLPLLATTLNSEGPRVCFGRRRDLIMLESPGRVPGKVPAQRSNQGCRSWKINSHWPKLAPLMSR